MNEISKPNTAQLYQDIRQILHAARSKVYQTANSAMVLAYWEIGKTIVEQQGGNEKAEYGTALISELSKQLTEEFGKGFTTTNLKCMRQFYLAYPIRHTLCDELSWSHYRTLMRIPNEERRTWYTNECVSSNWSVRQLERQIHTMFYERLLASQEKAAVSAEIETLEPQPKYETVLRDPYIMEFLDLEKSPKYYEKDLETALINNLQKFLLELGRGFCFEARQKHFRLEDESYYIDLVFYNYILKCHVLIDLKMGKLTHQDLGQMQMYVNYYTRELMNEGDSLPIGLVLCADKTDSVVKYTLPEGNTQIFASKYMTYLPTEEELKKELNIAEYHQEIDE
ncbi:MAG: PDDEXK nuclease domain-containing protein [Faecalibacterium sp.]